MALWHVSIIFLLLAAVRSLQPPRICCRRDGVSQLGRAIAAATAAGGTAGALLSAATPARAAAPCVDGALRWRRYREGTGPKPPDACVEVPYNEAPEFLALSTDAARRRADADAARRVEDEKTRDAFRASVLGGFGGAPGRTGP